MNSLVDRYFDEARLVRAGSKPAMDIEASAIIRIAEDTALSMDFVSQFKATNDPVLKSRIQYDLNTYAIELEEDAEHTKNLADGITISTGTIGTGSIVAGIGAMFVTGGAAAPFLLGGGFIAVLGTGVSRYRLVRANIRLTKSAKRLRSLLAAL